MSHTNHVDAIEARHSAWYSGDDTTADWPDPIDFVVGYENDKDSTPRKRAMAHEITREDIPYLLDLARKQQAALDAVRALMDAAFEAPVYVLPGGYPSKPVEAFDLRKALEGK